MRRRMIRLLSSKWGKLYAACLLSAAALWVWSAVRTFASLGQDDAAADRLSATALSVALTGHLFLGLHERHLRYRRGEAEALDARYVLDSLRSLRTSANGMIAVVLITVGLVAWAYVWGVVRGLGWDVPGVPEADDGGLILASGTLSCAIGAVFAWTHFKERR